VNRFERTRADHRLETAEDYCELIQDLIRERGEARAVDLAERLGVSAVAVAKAVKRLARSGYVVSEPYRSVFLTPEGERLAEQVRHRHSVVKQFLLSLGVSEQAAAHDAEGIEHHICDETLRALERRLDLQAGQSKEPVNLIAGAEVDQIGPKGSSNSTS
jgi:DtxR family manganese transport transcriptional regulator